MIKSCIVNVFLTFLTTFFLHSVLEDIIICDNILKTLHTIYSKYKPKINDTDTSNVF